MFPLFATNVTLNQNLQFLASNQRSWLVGLSCVIVSFGLLMLMCMFIPQLHPTDLYNLVVVMTYAFHPIHTTCNKFYHALECGYLIIFKTKWTSSIFAKQTSVL